MYRKSLLQSNVVFVFINNIFLYIEKHAIRLKSVYKNIIINMKKHKNRVRIKNILSENLKIKLNSSVCVITRQTVAIRYSVMNSKLIKKLKFFFILNKMDLSRYNPSCIFLYVRGCSIDWFFTR